MTDKKANTQEAENESNVENDSVDTSSEGKGRESDMTLEKLKAEVEDYKDKYLRNVAEFDNFRRRNARERVELIQTAGKEVITELLEVLDDCDRAQKQLETAVDIKEVKEGVLLVFNKFRNKLQARGVKPMDARHSEFNPDLHEAVTEIPAPSPELSGKVIDEIIPGYYLNDKIIRHAKVVVGK